MHRALSTSPHLSWHSEQPQHCHHLQQHNTRCRSQPKDAPKSPRSEGALQNPSENPSPKSVFHSSHQHRPSAPSLLKNKPSHRQPSGSRVARRGRTTHTPCPLRKPTSASPFEHRDRADAPCLPRSPLCSDYSSKNPYSVDNRQETRCRPPPQVLRIPNQPEHAILPALRLREDLFEHPPHAKTRLLFRPSNEASHQLKKLIPRPPKS